MIFDWNSKTILIAEDEPANFLFIEKIINPSQATIIRAETGEEAIEILKQNPQIDLVLMDIYMPGMDGFETTEIIRQLRPGLPVVAQTFYENQIEKQKVISAKFDDFISKPININKLLVILEKYLKSESQTA
ncbi:MAG: response regulator [Salinivirgaceae bacterium]|jgi:CheY-like chemotaxis protein|nr:response regulator [Salinivirgaceae bacterium]